MCRQDTKTVYKTALTDCGFFLYNSVGGVSDGASA